MLNGDFDADGVASEIYREIGAPTSTQVQPLILAQRILGADSVRLVPATALPGVGAIARVRDRWIIFLREDAPKQAKRFVLCHELAHRVLGTSATEVECDALAAALLLPREAFLAAARACRERLPTLAREFCASESCVALRLGETTQQPLALVTPRYVRTRGAEWHWPGELRALSEATKIPGIRRVQLQDDPARRVLRRA